MSGSIATPRLELVSFTPAFYRASLDGDFARAAELLGASLPGVWPTYPDTFQLRLSELEADPALQPWLLRGMILRHERRLIGHIGFHTGPNPDYLKALAPGGIELGFTVLASFRRQGLAREATEALMAWARAEHGITRFVLSIQPDNLPSLALARRLGFERIGEWTDEVDGLEHVFRLDFCPEAAR
jgi:RimJ/RimL family protein N-acetyltransferase